VPEHMTPETPEDWGRLAVSLPGWRWLPGMVEIDGALRVVASEVAAATGLYRGKVAPPDSGSADGWLRAWSVNFDPMVDDALYGRLPDPDDPATEGCLLRLIGPRVLVRILPRESVPVVEVVIPSGMMKDGRPHRVSGAHLGRTLIAAAAALGEWPGGAR